MNAGLTVAAVYVSVLKCLDSVVPPGTGATAAQSSDKIGLPWFFVAEHCIQDGEPPFA